MGRGPIGRRAAAAGLVMLLLLSVGAASPRRALATFTVPDSEVKSPPAEGNVDPAEQEVLAQLFALNRAQEEARAQIAQIAGDVSRVQGEQAAAAAERDRLEARRQQQMALFGRRLRYYHEESALAPMAFVLASDTFTEFLQRVEIWTDILDADARLLADLRQLKSAVADQEQGLAAKEAELKQLLHDSQAQSEKLAADIAQKEAILTGLRSKRAEIEAQLAKLEQDWETKAKPVLESLGTSLQTVNLSDFQPDSLKASLFPPGVETRFSAESLTRLLQSQADLKGMKVELSGDRVNLLGDFDGIQVTIAGHFTMAGKTLLRYAPDQITVDNIKVPDDVTAAMMESGQLDIDMAAILGPWSLKEVHIEGEQLVVKAGMK